MSWTFASLALLGVALFGGFAWYERRHPPAKIVALVATLAALAALGRIAFAPVPNVKPTTTIVLIAGFALGASPGFVVGAVAALASNLFFGQGPWTPWQMFAWGLVGLLGAALAHAVRRSQRGVAHEQLSSSRRQLGRVPLALWCGVASLGFGAIMDLSTWTVFAGAHTLGQYFVIAGTALPFNIAHAVGSIAFALAFGPALVAALERFRMRFEVEWVAPAPARHGAAESVGSTIG